MGSITTHVTSWEFRIIRHTSAQLAQGLRIAYAGPPHARRHNVADWKNQGAKSFRNFGAAGERRLRTQL